MAYAVMAYAVMAYVVMTHICRFAVTYSSPWDNKYIGELVGHFITAVKGSWLVSIDVLWHA